MRTYFNIIATEENSMIKISPSLLAADFSKLGDEIKKVENGGAEYLHLDVMDGVFVPNISFGIPVIKSLRKCSDMVFDTHLMITKPDRYVEAFADAGADIITIHYESCDDQLETLKHIKALGKKAAMSVKPKTSAEVLKPFLPYLDMILVMTVEPGFGGQKFMTDAVENVRISKRLATESGYDIDIEVDGGINAETAAICAKAGANVFVAGSSVFRADDAGKAISEIRASAATV